MKGGDGSSEGMLEALEKLVDNLRKECYATFVRKDENKDFENKVDDLDKRVTELEKGYKVHKNKLGDHDSRINTH